MHKLRHNIFPSEESRIKRGKRAVKVMPNPESPPEILELAQKAEPQRAVRATRVWGGPWRRMKGPAEWPLSVCVPNLPSNCPQAEGCFVPENSAGLTLPLASESDSSSKGRPLRPARPVSTSKCPEPAMFWWSSAHTASHAGIVCFLGDCLSCILLKPLCCSLPLCLPLLWDSHHLVSLFKCNIQNFPSLVNLVKVKVFF